MTIIRITEFKGYTEEDLFQFLRIHPRSFYEIIIPINRKGCTIKEPIELPIKRTLN